MIDTSRLILRPLEEGDFQVWKGAIENLLQPQSQFDTSYSKDSNCSEQVFSRLIQSCKDSRDKDFSYSFFAFCKTSGQLIGDSQLWGVTRFECQRATLGYSVLNNHWRKGYGLEIAKATLEYGFEVLQLNRIEAEILPENKASVALCEKAGMQSEGIRRQALKVGSQFKDHLVMAIVASDRD